MSGDLLTVLSSGLFGAMSGAVVSWLVAPQLIGRQQRGEARAEAGKQIASLANRALTQVRQYRGMARGSMARVDEEKPSIHTDDILLCAKLLNHSLDLGSWRRRAVKRRLEKLFGENTVALCQMHGADAAEPQNIVAFVLNRQVMALRHAELRQPDRGQFDHALRCEPGSREVAALERQLKRLASCW